MKMLIALLVCLSTACAGTPKSILLLAGKPSHGPGQHEFHAGADLMAKALNDSGLPVRATVRYDAWPPSEELEGIDALVVYCDGNGKHPVAGHEAELLKLSSEGKGIVFLHYAVDGLPGLLDETLLKTIGGYYEDKVSKNPVWTIKNPVLADHPIARGVKPFDLKDEWYYNLKLGAVTPILQAVPPEEERIQTLAWTFGRNAFGFTGWHFLDNWSNPDFRRLLLNAAVWCAGLDVPEGGVGSAKPVVASNPSILQAIAKGDAEDVMNHILLGADVNAPNPQGWTPLHFAVVRGKTDCAKVLVEKGAGLDARTGTLKTPLHLAAERGFLDIIKLLVEKGADLSAQDDEGWSPLHYAAEKDHVDVAAYLIAHGAQVNMPSKRGGTPLHEASASASPEMIKLLLDHGADKTIKATNGKTPLDYATELGNAPAAALLK